MKKIVNIFLLVGVVISINIALKYSALPVPIFIPYKLAEFWVSSVEEQQQYVLLYDIAVGFIMSALFYFIVEEIPDRTRIHKSKQLIKDPINQLIQCMERIIDIVVVKYKINQNLVELTQKDFLVLDGETQSSMEEISYTTTLYYVKERKKKTAFHSYGTVNDVVKNNLKGIMKNVLEIKNYEYFYASDVRLVECIRKIESCNLIRYYLDNKDKSCFIFYGTSKAMFEFIVLYLQLLKCKIHTEYAVTILDSIEETAKYHSKRENGVLWQMAIDAQNKRQKQALANPTMVISSSKYTTELFISQLKRNLLAKFILFDDIQIENLANYKYVVFVVDSKLRNKVIHMLNEKEIQSGILLITEQFILKRTIRNKVMNINNNIVGELFFKSSFKLRHFPFIFNKNEPSERSIVNIFHQMETILYERDK